MCLAIPGKIISLIDNKDGVMQMGKVEMGGIVKEVNLHLVPDAVVNDYVLVHVGVALSIVDEKEAKQTLAFLMTTDELNELFDEEIKQQQFNDTSQN
jgi:hydrogenase expression/formation protein HypC